MPPASGLEQRPALTLRHQYSYRSLLHLTNNIPDINDSVMRWLYLGDARTCFALEIE